MNEGSIPDDWRTGLIVLTWKVNGDIQDLAKSCNEGAGEDSGREGKEECLYGDRRRAAEVLKGQGMMERMFTLRQLVEKRLEVQGEIAFGFVELEKAYDTAPRETVIVTLRWMGVPEVEFWWVEWMYKGMKGRLLVVPGKSDKFSVNIGLRQEALSAQSCLSWR